MTVPAYASLVVQALQTIATNTTTLAGTAGPDKLTVSYTDGLPGSGSTVVKVNVQDYLGTNRLLSPLFVLVEAPNPPAISPFNGSRLATLAANQFVLIGATDGVGDMTFGVTGTPGDVLQIATFNVSRAPGVGGDTHPLP